MRQIPGAAPLIANIGDASNVGLGKVGRDARHDVAAADSGDIEDMRSLRPVLSAIQARGSADYATGVRQIGKSLAFENQPALQAAMDSELSGKINEQEGTEFATAAGTAYDKASDRLTAAQRWQQQLRFQGAVAQTQANQGSYYDARRQGGVLPQMITAGIGIGEAAGMAAV